MRLGVELSQSEDGTVSGVVTRADEAVPFSGWLELLELLEAALDPQERAP